MIDEYCSVDFTGEYIHSMYRVVRKVRAEFQMLDVQMNLISFELKSPAFIFRHELSGQPDVFAMKSVAVMER